MDNFPCRLPSPVKTGGFYKYPKNSRTLPSLLVSSAEQKVKLGPSTQIIIEVPKTRKAKKSIIRESTQSLNQNSQQSLCSDDMSQSFSRKSLKDVNKTPPLVSSFSDILLNLPLDEFESLLPGQRNASVQTDVGELFCLELDDISEYKKWLKIAVDPFLKDLKKNILEDRPENVEGYCAAYCMALTMAAPMPVTINHPSPKSIRLPTKNSVSSKSSAIKLQSNSYGPEMN